MREDLPIFDELDPPQRLLMGPGPSNAYPRVLRAMSAPLLGQFDPEFTRYMNEVMALYRAVFETENRWTFLIDGTARAGIEAALVSLIEPGETVLIPSFGRFGLLLTEIAERCGARVVTIEAEWGRVFDMDEIEAAVERERPKLVACVHGDTSTTMVQPLDGLGEICSRYGALSYVDATATLGGMPVEVDAWGLDVVSAGLQKCLGGPPGSAPITISDRAADRVRSRRHVERGLAVTDAAPGPRPSIGSNYFDLAMLMDYWSEDRLNHHTEATSMLYAARECARLFLQEGSVRCFDRHKMASRAMQAGLEAMGLTLFGDPMHRMANVTGIEIPAGIDGERVRTRLRNDFEIEIGSSFGPLKGRIWRIGAMGHNARKHNVLVVLGALEAVLKSEGFALPSGAAVAAALAIYDRHP